MQGYTVHEATLDFLKKLSRNNEREWFIVNRQQYLKAKENVEHFVDGLIIKMNAHDRIETQSGKESLYRIYNDVRFSNDKSPYNPRFSGYLKRIKPMLRGGYYFRIKPGSSRVACGFAYPNPVDLKRIRIDIAPNYEDWTNMLQSRSIRSNFGTMLGDQVKTAPKGYSKDHPAIHLLRYKQYWFEHPFSDKEVIASDFLSHVNKIFKSIRPFFDYMSDVLTTDLNGEPLIR
jgi:uncharacterized protein (TIGR02453 family)